jgi:enoyl-CoA hydratase/carnithine racemase
MHEPVDKQIRRVYEHGIIFLTLTRDRKLNAVTTEMLAVIREAVSDLAEKEDARALVITGEGRYFTAGHDVGEFGPQESESGLVTRYRGYRALTDLFDDMEKVEKPVILAAQGPCLGLGVEMGSSCDFRLASESATFGLPEISTLAVLPGSGGVSRFTRIVGPHWAKWVVMAGETVTAREALRMGFVHRVLPDEGFADAVWEWTRKIVGFSPEALGLAKMAIDVAATADLRAARQFDVLANTGLSQSREHVVKIEAFKSRAD